MSKEYLYGLVGRNVTIDKKQFHGHKSYPTRSAAEKDAEEAKELGHYIRIIPDGTRFVLLTSIKKRSE